MAERRIILQGPDTITLSAQTVDKLIRAGDGNAALLYLYVLRAGGSPSDAQAAAALKRSEGDISSSMELLSRLGLLQYDEQAARGPAPAPARDEPPEYSAEDIRRELDNGTVFSSLVLEVQKSLGKLLSSDDLVRLFGIYDNLGLPPDVILHLVTYCIDENRKRYGPGKVPTLRYIEKAAYTWEREGITTLLEAERYLKRQEARKSLLGEVRQILQIKDRELSAGERKYIESWLAMGYTPEVIEIAYEKTLLKTGRLAWSYIDSIILSWHQKGLHTAEEIKTKDQKAPAARKTAPKKPVMTAEEDLADIERMKKYLKELRED